MTNAGCISDTDIPTILACELVIIQSVQGSGLEKQCVVGKVRAGWGALHFKVPGLAPSNSDHRKKQLALSFVAAKLSFPPHCQIRFHSFVKQQFILEWLKPVQHNRKQESTLPPLLCYYHASRHDLGQPTGGGGGGGRQRNPLLLASKYSMWPTCHWQSKI